jgi:hypothetical protein
MSGAFLREIILEMPAAQLLSRVAPAVQCLLIQPRQWRQARAQL